MYVCFLMLVQSIILLFEQLTNFLIRIYICENLVIWWKLLKLLMTLFHSSCLMRRKWMCKRNIWLFVVVSSSALLVRKINILVIGLARKTRRRRKMFNKYAACFVQISYARHDYWLVCLVVLLVVVGVSGAGLYLFWYVWERILLIGQSK